jgi:hypothetical protein
MTKINSMVLALVSLVGFTACGSDSPPASCPEGSCTVYDGTATGGSNSGNSTNNVNNIGVGGNCAGGHSSTSTTPICNVGAERCSCFGNNTCNSGLTCASGICVNFGTGNGTGGNSSVTCTAGNELCQCYTNNTCNSGLTCASGICVHNGNTGTSSVYGTGGATGDSCNACDSDTGNCVPLPQPGVNLTATDQGFSISLDSLAQFLANGHTEADFVRNAADSVISCAGSSSCMAATRCAAAGNTQFISWGTSDSSDPLWQKSYSGYTHGYCFYSPNVNPGSTLYIESPEIYAGIRFSHASGSDQSAVHAMNALQIAPDYNGGDRGPWVTCVLARDSVKIYR